MLGNTNYLVNAFNYSKPYLLLEKFVLLRLAIVIQSHFELESVAHPVDSQTYAAL